MRSRNLVKNSKLKYQRIKIETILPNGKKGALVIETPLLFSWGMWSDSKT